MISDVGRLVGHFIKGNFQVASKNSTASNSSHNIDLTYKMKMEHHANPKAYGI